MFSLARILIGVGSLLVLAGVVVYLLGRFGIPLGHLPGDFAVRRKNVAIYFPLGTCILLSILLTLLLYLLASFRK